MGVATNLFYVQKERQDIRNLDTQINQLQQTKVKLEQDASDITKVSTDMDPNSPEMQMLNQRAEKLKDIESQLDSALKLKQTMEASVNAMLPTSEGFEKSSIQRTFSNQQQ